MTIYEREFFTNVIHLIKIFEKIFCTRRTSNKYIYITFNNNTESDKYLDCIVNLYRFYKYCKINENLNELTILLDCLKIPKLHSIEQRLYYYSLNVEKFND